MSKTTALDMHNTCPCSQPPTTDCANPTVWWTGLVGLIWCLERAVRGENQAYCRSLCACLCLDALKCGHFKGGECLKNNVSAQSKALVVWRGTEIITPVLATLSLCATAAYQFRTLNLSQCWCFIWLCMRSLFSRLRFYCPRSK